MDNPQDLSIQMIDYLINKYESINKTNNNYCYYLEHRAREEGIKESRTLIDIGEKMNIYNEFIVELKELKTLIKQGK